MKKKKSNFLPTKIFKLLTNITENSINNCDLFLKYVISVTRHHFDYTPLALKKT